MSLTCVSLMLSGSIPVLKKLWTSLVTTDPTASQLEWKKQAENPSGPGALYGCIEKRAFLTSASVGTELRCLFISAETDGLIAWSTIRAGLGENMDESEEEKIDWK